MADRKQPPPPPPLPFPVTERTFPQRQDRPSLPLTPKTQRVQERIGEQVAQLNGRTLKTLIAAERSREFALWTRQAFKEDLVEAHHVTHQLARELSEEFFGMWTQFCSLSLQGEGQMFMSCAADLETSLRGQANESPDMTPPAGVGRRLTALERLVGRLQN